ncbi:unnamed protein product [Gongylonema pulchrum]|uniref:Uncharacterized protein n=1 Tax=Gongylonema pulchrum TaxID=637853 RepID=A0A183ETN1_9BILA|nr:unnamed protein product [Gongylonema pulchrum]
MNGTLSPDREIPPVTATTATVASAATNSQPEDTSALVSETTKLLDNHKKQDVESPVDVSIEKDPPKSAVAVKLVKTFTPPRENGENIGDYGISDSSVVSNVAVDDREQCSIM